MTSFSDAVARRDDEAARQDAVDADTAAVAARAAAETRARIRAAVAEFLDAMRQAGNPGLHSVPIIEMRDFRRQVPQGSWWNRTQREIVETKAFSTGSLNGWETVGMEGQTSWVNLAVLTDARLLSVYQRDPNNYNTYSFSTAPSVSPAEVRAALFDETRVGELDVAQISGQLVETYRFFRALHPRS